MHMLSDTRLDHPLLHDAFDLSQHPTMIKSAKPSTIQDEPSRRIHGRTLFRRHRCPSHKAVIRRRSRNISDPQFASTPNSMRESWFANFPTVHTVGDIASLSYEPDDFFANPSPNTAAPLDTVSPFDNNNLRKTPSATHEDSCETSGSLEASGYESEGSLYSMESAGQDAHPLLLSIPVIPQIKLERMATIRKPDPAPLSSTGHNQTFLSPRIPDLRTPARMSSRRYGRILSGPSAPAVISDASRAKSFGTLTLHVLRRFGSASWCDHSDNPTPEPGYQRSVSQPTLKSPCALDDKEEPITEKETDDSPHSDPLLSMINEADTHAGPHKDDSDTETGNAREPEQVLSKHAKSSHQRSSVNHSISFSSIVHAVADGCASLDHLLRKPRAKREPTTEPELISKAHDPTSKWAPKHGQIFIKVFVPSTDDIWMFRMPQDIGIVDFTSRVVTKLGFIVSFSGSVWDEPKYYFRTDEQFKPWVKGRIRFGRNLPIVAHALAPLPLVRLSVDADGCEVWCYA